MRILVTGGAGYIGSHTCIELVKAGFEVVIVDNLSNSKVKCVERVVEILGRELPFYNNDIRDTNALRKIFTDHQIDAVIHFAGLKAVGESCENPLLYYCNNINGTIALCQVMDEHGINKIVFSSSATVYGDPLTVPIAEDFSTAPTNPYGRTKLMAEEILRDLTAVKGSGWHTTLLRYFNPIGAHASGRLGEDPNGVPSNLLPYVMQVAIGKLPKLNVFGDDFDTADGTGIRDYIHVVDLAQGHVKALQRALSEAPACRVYNFGTGTGYSVMEIIRTFEKVSGKAVPYQIVERRAGDIAKSVASPKLAERELDWIASFGLEDMLHDSWNWQVNNPNGYE